VNNNDEIDPELESCNNLIDYILAEFMQWQIQYIADVLSDVLADEDGWKSSDDEPLDTLTDVIMNQKGDISNFINFVELKAKGKKELSFDIPSDKELSEIKPGDNVKIANEHERFWVVVTKVGKNDIYGRVANFLVATPLKHGEFICFKKENICCIEKGQS